jgi:hypothetical protein
MSGKISSGRQSRFCAAESGQEQDGGTTEKKESEKGPEHRLVVNERDVLAADRLEQFARLGFVELRVSAPRPR